LFIFAYAPPFFFFFFYTHQEKNPVFLAFFYPVVGKYDVVYLEAEAVVDEGIIIIPLLFLLFYGRLHNYLHGNPLLLLLL